MVHLRKHSNGHLIGDVVEGGHGHLARAVCSAEDCGYCDNDYYQYTITISGVSYCSDCFAGGGSTSRKVTSMPPSINGVWTVTQTLGTPWDNCLWQYYEEGNYGEFIYYPNEVDCTGAETPYPLSEKLLRLTKISNTQWHLFFRYGPSAMDVFSNRHYPSLVYCDGSVASGNCEEVIINNCVGCYYNGVLFFGENGSATITPVT